MSGNGRCDICQGKCIFGVARSVHGYLKHVPGALIVLMLAMYMAHHWFSASFAAPAGAINETLYIWTILSLVLASLILSRMDMVITRADALRAVRDIGGEHGCEEILQACAP